MDGCPITEPAIFEARHRREAARLTIALTLLFGILLYPIIATAQQAQTQPTGTIAVEDSAEQDARIAMRIRTILNELEGYEDVTVAVRSGIVSLRGTTPDQARANQLGALVTRVDGVVAVENHVTQTTDMADQLNPALDRFRNRMWQLVTYMPLAAFSLAAFLLVAMLGFLLARMKWPWDRIAPNAFIADIYRQFVRLAFLVAGVVAALDILNASALLSTILGAAGIVGLAIGFAVRDTVENFIASIMLSIRQPFRPNDMIEIEGDIGKVIRLTSRATILLSFDGNHIRIPNATVFKSRIVNYTRNDERRFVLELGVAYDSDLVAVQDLMLKTVRQLPFVLPEPAPAVWIEGPGDSAVILRVAAWIAQNNANFLAARGEAYRICLATLHDAAVEMPGPTYTIVGLPDSETSRAPAVPGRIPAPVPVPERQDVQTVDTQADRELDRIISAEREAQSGSDLLNRSAPEE
jgi:small conductance mechanosensitive channel